MFFGSGRLSQGSSAVTSITFVGYTQLTSTFSGSYPSGTQDGDIAILFDQNKRGTTGSPETPPVDTNYPSGYSLLLNQIFNASPAVQNFRVVLSYKILNSSDISSGVSNLMGNGATSWLVVFRPNIPTTSLVFSTPSCEITTSNPSYQNIYCANVATPVVALAWFFAQAEGGEVDPRSSTASMDELEDSTSPNPYESYIKYKIYNITDIAETIAVGMEDETSSADTKNILTSFYLKVL